MFACALYPGDAAFIGNVAQEVTYQVMRKEIRKGGDNEIKERKGKTKGKKQEKEEKVRRVLMC